MTVAFKPTPNQFVGRGNCVLEATWAVRNDLTTESIMQAYLRTGKYKAKTGAVWGRVWYEAFTMLGIRYREMKVGLRRDDGRVVRKPTVATFVRNNPRGVIFLWTTRHAMAIINGTIIDANYARSGKPQSRGRVRGAMLITNPRVKTVVEEF